MRRSGLIVALFIASTAPAPAIVGGEIIDRWMTRPTVAVLRDGRGACSGVAISADVVLTAAHCVPSGQTIRVGTPRIPWTTVDETIRHPDFIADKPRVADLALLKLSRPVLSETARLTARPVSAGKPLSVVGYGIADDGKQDMRLRMVALTLKAQASGLLQLARSDAASGGNPGAACGGDSGGPVFSLGYDVPLLVGIVHGGDKGCRGSTYVTPLSRYHHWIIDTAEKLAAKHGQ